MSQTNMVKNVWWLYQARRVNTQTNAGGGALQTRISMAAGQVGKIVQMYVQGTASAGALLSIDTLDEDSAAGVSLASVAAGANRTANLPSIGTAATSTGNTAATTNIFIGPGHYVRAYSSAALQNETQTVFVVLLLSTPTEPTWDTTGSAGTPSLAASTISTANTLQAVVL